MLLFGFGLLLATYVAALPPPIKRSDVGSLPHLYDDALMPEQSVGLQKRRLPIPEDFQRLYVSSNGGISNYTDDQASTIEIYGSPRAPRRALNTAATVVARMTRHMPTEIFKNLAEVGIGAGVFTYSEGATIYPDNAYHKNSPQKCGRSCKGSCAYTCTSDGRKYDDLPGMGGRIATVIEENLLCQNGDPYSYRKSILVSEFSRNIKLHGLNPDLQNEVDDAYIAAKDANIWKNNKYAMRSSDEYWAQASTVFLATNHLSEWNAAGMNMCYAAGPTYCRNESEGRKRLLQKDPKLYNILVKVFTDDKPDLAMEVFLCPPSVRE